MRKRRKPLELEPPPALTHPASTEQRAFDPDRLKLDSSPYGLVIEAKGPCAWGGCEREPGAYLHDRDNRPLCTVHAAENAGGKCECCGDAFVPEYNGADVYSRYPGFPSAARAGAALCIECASA